MEFIWSKKITGKLYWAHISQVSGDHGWIRYCASVLSNHQTSSESHFPVVPWWWASRLCCFYRIIVQRKLLSQLASCMSCNPSSSQTAQARCYSCPISPTRIWNKQATWKHSRFVPWIVSTTDGPGSRLDREDDLDSLFVVMLLLPVHDQKGHFATVIHGSAVSKMICNDGNLVTKPDAMSSHVARRLFPMS